MTKLLILTAFLAGVAATQQASACEWMREAAQLATVASCDNGNCPTEQQTQQETAATETAPAAPQSAQEPAPAAPTILACSGKDC